MKGERRKIYIFDTTLRDGEQSPGASLTPEEKVKIAQQLERLNVDVIEAGFPVSSPGELKAVQLISEAVSRPTICALARTVSQDIDACRRALERAKRKRLHLFLATSQIHRKYKLRKGKKEILDIAAQHIRSARKDFRDIEFSPEDAARTERDFLVDAVRTAVDAGATVINIPDTVGYAVPQEFGELITLLVKKIPVLGKKVTLSVHCHNDLGLAAANSLAAVLAGANQVECTVNGIGERAGNASMEEIVMAIDTRKDFVRCSTQIRLEEIIKTSRLVSHLTGMVVQPNKAIVCRNAFSHESGIHQDGILKMRQTYEIIDPKRLGLSGSQIILGKLSGRHAFNERVQKLGYHLGEKELDRAFERFKKIADQKKYVFDEDIESLIQDEITEIPETWRLDYLKINLETGRPPEATLRLRRQKKEAFEATSQGDGPVDACYKAIEKIIKLEAKLQYYAIQSVTSGKDALGEVTVKLQIEGREVTGRGASTDIIEASVRAYLFAVNKVCARLLGEEPKSSTV